MKGNTPIHTLPLHKGEGKLKKRIAAGSRSYGFLERYTETILKQVQDMVQRDNLLDS
jgi:hypothetical protein